MAEQRKQSQHAEHDGANRASRASTDQSGRRSGGHAQAGQRPHAQGTCRNARHAAGHSGQARQQRSSRDRERQAQRPAKSRAQRKGATRTQPHSAQPHAQRHGAIPVPAIVGAVAALVLVMAGVVFACTRLNGSVENAQRSDAEASVAQSDQSAEPSSTATTSQKPAKVSFCAVGDNLINEGGDYTADLLGLADSWSGEAGDGKYDFSPLYDQVRDVISSYDIALINQETVLGGRDDFEYQGYPSYNTPDSMAKAVANAGFDVVNFNSNHSYDIGAAAIEHAQKVWAKQTQVSVIGSYEDEEDRNNIRVVEHDGMKIAFLSYSYGQNGYDQSDLPNDYYAVPFDKAKMKEEVAAAKELADAVVVYMHWGDENTHELNEQQRDYASYLAGLGVDLTIGSHAHVIQPVAYVSRGTQSNEESSTDSDDDAMLCVYGLGDFVSGYTLPKTILSGMFTCDFVRDEDGKVTVQNPVWHGLVEHNEGDEDAVYLLSEYTQKQAESNTLLARVGENDSYTTSDPLAWAKQTTRDVIGDVIDVDV